MRIYYGIIGGAGIVLAVLAAQHFHMPWYWGAETGFVPGTLVAASYTLRGKR